MGRELWGAGYKAAARHSAIHMATKVPPASAHGANPDRQHKQNNSGQAKLACMDASIAATSSRGRKVSMRRNLTTSGAVDGVQTGDCYE